MGSQERRRRLLLSLTPLDHGAAGHYRRIRMTTTITALCVTAVLLFIATPSIQATTQPLSFSILPRLFTRRVGSQVSTTSFSSSSASIFPRLFTRRAGSTTTSSSTAVASTTPDNPQPPSPSAPLADLGFSFSPAGLLFPYHLGVASVLREKRLLNDKVPLGGSSAGALVAALIGADIPIRKALDACHTINDQWSGAMSFTKGITESLNFDFGGGTGIDKTHEEAVAAALAAGDVLPPPIVKNVRTGNSKTLKALLHEVLDEVLPQDAHLRLNARAGKVTIGVTELGWSGLRANFFLRPRAFSSFTSREDLIEVLLASCNVPILFSGFPSLSCRGLPSIDGYFSVPPHRFGCPYLPAAARTVLVSPFPASAVERGPGPTEEERRGREWLSPEVRRAEEGGEGGGTMRELLKDAWSVNGREVVEKYYEMGRRDAFVWVETSGFVKRRRGVGGLGLMLSFF